MSVDITALAIQVTSTGIAQASKELGNLTTSAANTERRINSLITTLQRLQTLTQSMGAGSNALTSASSRMSQSLIQQRRDMEMYNIAGREYSRAHAEAIRMNREFDRSLQQSGGGLRRNNDAMREAHGLARGLTGSLGALWLTYGNFAGMATGLAIGASLKAIVTIGKDVEHTLEGIRVRGMESVGAVDKIRESVYKLGSGVHGPLEVAKAFDIMVMAGLSAKDAVSGMSAALNLALIGGTTIEKAAFTLVQVSTALGYSAEGFSRVGDVIAKTAAVSMSSVESLSEAFKSGSVVGKLYGVSLVDIGTAFAALSNLGIKGSAAGTSLKNMYKELAADSKKLQETLSLIGLKPTALKDAEGNFLPLIQMFKVLDDGLKKFGASEQKILLGRMANERGMKSLVEMLDLYREALSASEKGATGLENKLQKMNEAINASYGFMAQGAAAMALTVDSQFKSVKNTLQVTLVKAFQDIQPELSLVARGLKDAFGSDQFQRVIQGLATGTANLALFMVQNAEAIWMVVRALLAFKAAAMIVGVLTGIASAFIALKTAMDLARISAIAFQASLGLLGVALAAGAALWVWWATKRDEATNAKQAAAINYMEDFKSKLDEENASLWEQIDLMEKGKTAADAYAEAQRNLQMQKVKVQGSVAIAEAQKRVTDLEQGFTPDQRRGINNWRAGNENVGSYNGIEIKAIKAYSDAIKNLGKVQDEVRVKEEQTAKSLEKHIWLSNLKAGLADKQAKDANKMPSGTVVITPEKDKTAERDLLQASLNKMQAEIKAARKLSETKKITAQSEYKQGVIGEITLIEKLRQAEVGKQASIAEAADDKLKVLLKQANQESAIASARAEIEAAMEATTAANAQAKNSLSELEVANGQKLLKFEADKFESMKQFENAYKAEFAGKHAIELKRMKDNIEAEKDIFKRGELEKLKIKTEAAYDAGVNNAANRDAVNAFNTEVEGVRNALKSVQTATEGSGLAAMFDAAKAASARYKAALDTLSQKKGIVDPQDLVEAQANLNNLAENQRKMWVGVGESISDSLSNAFGAGGKAAGDLIKIATKFNLQEDKSGKARIKSYGDAAGAAKGFFKEGTTGYKLMEGAEKAFRAIELVGMMTSLATTGSTEAAKNAIKTPGALLSFMSSMPAWAWAGAGLAVAAVLSGGGGGGPSVSEQRQKTQGTGSVLGDSDAKSASIANSLSIMEKNSGLGLAQGNQMVGYLRTVASSISNLASLIVRTTGITGNTAIDTKSFSSKSVSTIGAVGGAASFGGAGAMLGSFLGPIGTLLGGVLGSVLGAILGGGFLGKTLSKVFGGSTSVTDTGFTLGKTSLAKAQKMGVNASQFTDIKKDGGYFHSDKNSTQLKGLGTEANDQFSKIIMNMSGAVNAAADILGFGGEAFKKRLGTFVIDIGKISLKGLTGDQVQKEIEAAFSKLGDDMAKFAIVGLEKFQAAGEGYFETVARLSADVLQVQQVFSVLGKTFDLTGMAAINVSQGLIEAAGGMERLLDGTKFFVDNFLTEAERMAPITNSVNKRLKELNVSELTTIELYKKKIRSLDLTNAADQQLYASLIELAPAFKEAADYAERLADGTVSLTKAQQRALDNINKARENLQKAYDSESNALQNTIDKTKSYVQTLKDFQNSLKLGTNSPLTNMEKYAEARSQLNTIGAAAQGGDVVAQQKFTSIANEFLNASRVVNASGAAFTADFNRVQTMTGSLVDAAVGQIDVATASLAALNRQVEGLLSIDKSVMSVTQAITELRLAIEAGKTAGINATGTPVVVPVIATPSGPTAAQFADAMVVLHGVQAAIVDLKVSGQAVGANLAEVVMDSSQENADTTVAGFKNTKVNNLSYV